MDQPSIDGFNTFYASSCVKKEGIKVVLSGVGADEIFSGYTTINKIIVSQKNHWTTNSANSLEVLKPFFHRAIKSVVKEIIINKPPITATIIWIIYVVYLRLALNFSFILSK